MGQVFVCSNPVAARLRPGFSLRTPFLDDFFDHLGDQQPEHGISRYCTLWDAGASSEPNSPEGGLKQPWLPNAQPANKFYLGDYQIHKYSARLNYDWLQCTARERVLTCPAPRTQSHNMSNRNSATRRAFKTQQGKSLPQEGKRSRP